MEQVVHVGRKAPACQPARLIDGSSFHSALMQQRQRVGLLRLADFCVLTENSVFCYFFPESSASPLCSIKYLTLGSFPLNAR